MGRTPPRRDYFRGCGLGSILTGVRGLVRLEEEQRRIKQTERETRRTRIETRYRVAIIRFQLNPNNFYRRQLADILALLEEYQDTL